MWLRFFKPGPLKSNQGEHSESRNTLFSGSGCKLCRPVLLNIVYVSTLNNAQVILKEIRNCRECSLFSSYVAVTLESLSSSSIQALGIFERNMWTVWVQVSVFQRRDGVCLRLARFPLIPLMLGCKTPLIVRCSVFLTADWTSAVTLWLAGGHTSPCCAEPAFI